MTVTSAPVPSQQRSRDKRERLLAAAIELLAEHGARGITHRAVAARAGVAPASTTYYFESIQALVDEALAVHVRNRRDELSALVDAALAAGGTPAEVSNLLATSLVDRAEDAMVAQFEVYLEAWRNPALRGPVGDALGAFEAMAVAALTALGVAEPELHAAGFLAAADGFALHRLARPRRRDDEQAALRATLRALFIGAIMDPAEQARWDTRLGAPAPARD